MSDDRPHTSTAGMGSPIIVFPPGYRWQNSLILLGLFIALLALITVVLATLNLSRETAAASLQLSGQIATAKSDAAYAKAKSEFVEGEAKHAEMEADLANYGITQLRIEAAKAGFDITVPKKEKRK